MAVEGIAIEFHEMLVVGVSIVLGYIVGRVFISRGIPDIIGYMVVGVFLGEAITGFISYNEIEFLTPFVDLALAFIGFGIGVELRVEKLVELIRDISYITITHGLGVFILVFGATYIITSDIPISLLLASIAISTAPAATVKVIWDYNSEGELTTMLYSLVAIDDIFTSLVFAMAYPLAESLIIGYTEAVGVLLNTLYHMFGSIILGALIGILLDYVINRSRRDIDMVWSIVLTNILITGIAETFELSTILISIVAGFVAVNRSGPEEEETFHVIRHGVEPLLILFFVVMGSHFKFEYIALVGMLGVIYIVTRIVGKYLGTYIGGYISGAPSYIRNYLGLGLLAQGGLSLALASSILTDLGGINGYAYEVASVVFTVILATTFIFEILGPIAVKHILFAVGEAEEEY